MKFLKAKAAASRVLEGRESELTMLRRLSEYWGFLASVLSADSAVEKGLFISQMIAGQRRSGRATEEGQYLFGVGRDRELRPATGRCDQCLPP
jgi:hypothetical protein